MKLTQKVGFLEANEINPKRVFNVYVKYYTFSFSFKYEVTLNA